MYTYNGWLMYTYNGWLDTLGVYRKLERGKKPIED